MITRLLLSTLVALSAGTAAFTFGAAETELSKPPALQIEKAEIEKPAEQPRPLSRLEKWQADQHAERDAAKTQTQMPASHVSPKIQGPALASGASAKNTQTNMARPLVTLSSGVSVSEPDRTRITEAVARMTVRPLRGVDFSVAVGSQVPRELRLYSLPAEVVEIVPQYRDNRFMVVDKEILIVEPSSQKIVAILPRDAAVNSVVATTTQAAPAPMTATAVTTALASVPSPVAVQASTPNNVAEPGETKIRKQAASARAERRMARRASRDDWRRSHAEVRVGQRVPDNVVLRDLPQPYRSDVNASRARTIVQID